MNEKETAAAAENEGAEPFAAAQLMIPYIRETETFIYEKITHFKTVLPVVLTNQTTDAAEFFPVDRYHALDWEPIWTILWNKWIQRTRREPPPFFAGVLEKEKARLIHAHFGPVGAWAIPLKKASGLPLIVGFYGIDAGDALLKNNPRMAESYRRLFEEADLFVALSLEMMARLIDMGCPEERTVIHPLAIDLNVFKAEAPRAAPDGRIEILAVGRLVEKKGFVPLMEAFGRIMARRKLDARLTVIGEGPLRDDLCKAIDRHNLYLHNSLPGVRSRAQTLEAMRRAHIFVAPSRTASNGDREGTPTVILEAQACSLPVLTTDHAGIPETVDAENGAIVVPEGDDKALEERLEWLIDHPERWAAMGEAGRAFVEKNHDIEAVCETIEADYRRVAK